MCSIRRLIASAFSLCQTQPITYLFMLRLGPKPHMKKAMTEEYERNWPSPWSRIPLAALAHQALFVATESRRRRVGGDTLSFPWQRRVRTVRWRGGGGGRPYPTSCGRRGAAGYDAGARSREGGREVSALLPRSRVLRRPWLAISLGFARFPPFLPFAPLFARLRVCRGIPPRPPPARRGAVRPGPGPATLSRS